ncbi:MAG: SgcJ/EcaC family oxidoreductase [Solirubrobacterales bacterium]|nr:SgcJ/EcaC family oxidoreductase [Solirubrobacterales bacterium]
MPADSPAALSAAFAAAVNARDIDAALALWIEDAAIVSPDGQSIRGREAIGAALHALVENDASVEIDVAELYAAGDVALAVGSLTINGADAEGTPYSQQSQSLVIYARGADGAWRVAIDAPWGLPKH